MKKPAPACKRKTPLIFLTEKPKTENRGKISREICYFLQGEVTVTPEGGEPVTMGKGDLVSFPAGMKCTWKITKDVRKHYRLG